MFGNIKKRSSVTNTKAINVTQPLKERGDALKFKNVEKCNAVDNK